jgi:hypothetical protein
MNENLDIFILTYKNFKQQVSNSCYKVVSCVDDKIDTTLPILYDTMKSNKENGIEDTITDWNAFYSELTMTYWLWKNYQLKDYVGICQYRRYFQFMDDIPNMDNIFKEYDAILPTPYQFQCNVMSHYFIYHNILDLDIMLEVINELYPQYKEASEIVMKGNTFYPCNMLIMKKQDFKEYCEFVFNVIDGYLDKINVDYLEDVEKRVMHNWSNYHKSFYPNNTLWYQMRIGGFLAERLLNIFVNYNFKNVMHVPIVITEEKY